MRSTPRPCAVRGRARRGKARRAAAGEGVQGNGHGTGGRWSGAHGGGSREIGSPTGGASFTHDADVGWAKGGGGPSGNQAGGCQADVRHGVGWCSPAVAIGPPHGQILAEITGGRLPALGAVGLRHIWGDIVGLGGDETAFLPGPGIPNANEAAASRRCWRHVETIRGRVHRMAGTDGRTKDDPRRTRPRDARRAAPRYRL